MRSKKFKIISIVIFIAIYSMTLCFNSFSYALTSSASSANVTTGVYYFKNQNNNLYISDLDYMSMILGSFSGEAQQRWEITSASNGYYRIKNIYTGKYLTAPTDYSEGSLIEQANLSTNATIQDRQLWAFTQIGTQFRIQAKSHESSGLYLASSASINVYGYALIQTSNPANNREKWVLEQIKTAYLIGIEGDEEDHDHSSSLICINGRLAELGYDSDFTITDYMLLSTVKNYLGDCEFFAMRGHGNVDSNKGCFMELTSSEASTLRLHSDDIYNFTSNSAVVNMSKCEVALFIGCHTANHSIKSMPKAAVAAGADTSVGFADYINCDDAEYWTEVFGDYYTCGYSAEYSAEIATLDGGVAATTICAVIERNSN